MGSRFRRPLTVNFWTAREAGRHVLQYWILAASSCAISDYRDIFLDIGLDCALDVLAFLSTRFGLCLHSQDWLRDAALQVLLDSLSRLLDHILQCGSLRLATLDLWRESIVSVIVLLNNNAHAVLHKGPLLSRVGPFTPLLESRNSFLIEAGQIAAVRSDGARMRVHTLRLCAVFPSLFFFLVTS
jgi:hypothetical protein